MGSRNCRVIGVYWDNGNESSGIFSRHGRTSERFAEVVVVPLVGWRPGRRARLLTSFFLKLYKRDLAKILVNMGKCVGLLCKIVRCFMISYPK
ncbi:hypothetical protein OCA96_12125 [Bacillus cereus]|nr:hypothetical protein [Bacillus cereus]